MICEQKSTAEMFSVEIESGNRVIVMFRCLFQTAIEVFVLKALKTEPSYYGTDICPSVGLNDLLLPGYIT